MVDLSVLLWSDVIIVSDATGVNWKLVSYVHRMIWSDYRYRGENVVMIYLSLNVGEVWVSE